MFLFESDVCKCVNKKKRKSIFMFSRVINFFDKPKISRKFFKFGRNKNNDNKSMEWRDEDDEDDQGSVDSLSWSRTNALQKSESDSSITAIGDCNYRTKGTQVSLENYTTQMNVTSASKNLDLSNEDEYEIDEKIELDKDYHGYNQFDHTSLYYGFKTQDLSTNETVLHGPEILNFQGNKHSSKEIALTWKKDCRMWLWKSVRFSNRQNKKSTAINL